MFTRLPFPNEQRNCIRIYSCINNFHRSFPLRKINTKKKCMHDDGAPRCPHHACLGVATRSRSSLPPVTTSAAIMGSIHPTVCALGNESKIRYTLHFLRKKKRGEKDDIYIWHGRILMGAGRTVVFLDGLPHDLFTTQSMLLFKKKSVVRHGM